MFILQPERSLDVAKPMQAEERPVGPIILPNAPVKASAPITPAAVTAPAKGSAPVAKARTSAAAG
jgi:hypothetical protein